MALISEIKAEKLINQEGAMQIVMPWTKIKMPKW